MDNAKNIEYASGSDEADKSIANRSSGKGKGRKQKHPIQVKFDSNETDEESANDELGAQHSLNRKPGDKTSGTNKRSMVILEKTKRQKKNDEYLQPVRVFGDPDQVEVEDEEINRVYIGYTQSSKSNRKLFNFLLFRPKDGIMLCKNTLVFFKRYKDKDGETVISKWGKYRISLDYAKNFQDGLSYICKDLKEQYF